MKRAFFYFFMLATFVLFTTSSSGQRRFGRPVNNTVLKPRTTSSKALRASPRSQSENISIALEAARGEKRSVRLNGKQTKEIQRIISLLRNRQTDNALNMWKLFVKGNALKYSMKDQVQLARHIAWHSFLAPNKNLARNAKMLLYYTEQEKALKIKHAHLLKIQRSKANEATDTSLGHEIKVIETKMEHVRNKRQEFMTMFENFDQKANQLFNLLSTVMKSMKEMMSSGTRNIL